MNLEHADSQDEALARRIAIVWPLARKVAGVHGAKAPGMEELPEALEDLAAGGEPRAFVARASTLTEGFAIPSWACGTYRRLIDELRGLVDALEPGRSER